MVSFEGQTRIFPGYVIDRRRDGVWVANGVMANKELVAGVTHPLSRLDLGARLFIIMFYAFFSS